MSGTIIINKDKSFDVRTTDFSRIVAVLRYLSSHSETATKLLKTVDQFGMNMICADDLDSAEFTNFAQSMREVCAVLGEEDAGLSDFLASVNASIRVDDRLADSGWCTP